MNTWQDEALSDRLRRVAAKLAVAAGLPGEPVMFGANTHRFRLGPPLSEDGVAVFERQHGVRLPEAYRGFIRRVGHGGPGRFGGAGPYYGLHPLENWDAALWGVSAPGTLATPFSAEPGHVYEDWPAEVTSSDDDEPYVGTLALSDQGCGYLSILVVTGLARGRVADNGDDRTGPAFTSDADFLAWYERWLDAVLAGERHFR